MNLPSSLREPSIQQWTGYSERHFTPSLVPSLEVGVSQLSSLSVAVNASTGVEPAFVFYLEDI